MGAEARALVPDLLQAVKDKNSDVATDAAITLWKLNEERDAALPLMLAALKNNSSWQHEKVIPALQRERVISAFAASPAQKEIAVRALNELLNDKDKWVRSNIVHHLAGDYPYRPPLDASESVRLIRKALHDNDEHVRDQAIEALEKWGPAAKQAVPDLLEIIDRFPPDPLDLSVRKAAKALRKIDPEAAAKIGLL
jgi:HEAT repeat protein